MNNSPVFSILRRLWMLLVVLSLSVGAQAWAVTGDANGDNVVDITDVNMVINSILSNNDSVVANVDVNDDGIIDVSDINSVIGVMLWQDMINDKATYDAIALPLLHITTVDGELPTCDYVEHPTGAFGRSITNATKVPGRIVITLLGDTVYDSGDYVKGVSGMTIRINGNTSAYYDNKPYKIKLQAKADLLNRGDETCEDKEWRLLRDDRQLHAMVGFMVSELVGMQYTPHYQFCNVMINGEYRGVYVLVESIKRNTSCRIDVKKTGYIVERDAYWWNEDVSFKSTFFADNRYGWTFKYPDKDDVTQEQIDYIQGCIIDAEASIDAGTYDENFDVPSMAAWLLAHDILSTWDSGGSNLFMAKRDTTASSLLTMVCMWDFDSNRRTGTNSWSRYHSGDDFYFEKLLASENTAFSHAYSAKWAELKDSLLANINSRLDAFAASPTAAALDASRKYHSEIYGSTLYSVDTNVSTYKAFFNSHLTWLNNNITPVQDE